MYPIANQDFCPKCNEQVAPGADQCASCLWWFPDQIISRLNHADPRIREAAVGNLLFCDRTQPTAMALSQMLNDPVRDVRRAAGAMLFTIGTAAKHVVPALIVALADDDYYIRRTAAAALSNVGTDVRAAIATLTALKNTKDQKLRAWVVEALKAEKAPRPPV